MRKLLANRLMALFASSQREDWLWFENVLAYDNARLPQALIQTGLATHTTPYVEAGLQSLRWLMSLQTASSGCFRPVGSQELRQNSSSARSIRPAAARSSCHNFCVLRRVDARTIITDWPQAAMRAFAWFLGENDLQTALIDPDTGSCSDGLHPDRPNENKGAESVLSYLLALVEIRQFVATAAVARTKPASKLSSNGIGTEFISIAPREHPCPNPNS